MRGICLPVAATTAKFEVKMHVMSVWCHLSLCFTLILLSPLSAVGFLYSWAGRRPCLKWKPTQLAGTRDNGATTHSCDAT